ncbi:hypothetical protein J7355_13140 [Endozoicomonas sp. G2_2]|uniref:hypothetical protein n=1 Tax=Endozoicomonas sp. G2_2 TaxID=2821092 RepID=UPI001ADB55EE|nr:hypothetical protein [Endozoicomonas sp. G2_2]MBO9471039.1 hypothetical protein [Endozoicomonas sp. G2_2]
MRTVVIWAVLICGLALPNYAASAPHNCDSYSYILRTYDLTCSREQWAKARAWRNRQNRQFEYNLESSSPSAVVHSMNTTTAAAFGRLYDQTVSLEIVNMLGEPRVIASAAGPFEMIEFECPGDYCHLPVYVSKSERLWIRGPSNGVTVVMKGDHARQFLKDIEGRSIALIDFPLEKPHLEIEFMFDLSGFRRDLLFP